MSNLLRVAVGGLLVATSLAGGQSAAGRQEKAVVCHLQANGTINAIEIADPALPAHIDHGDGLPGDPVPGMDGFEYGATCVPELAASDGDGDGVADPVDNCPTVANADQADLDQDGLGDPCDADADGDGFAPPTDCDDADAAINPGAPETPYDDIDQNCSGFDLTDVDGDGFSAEQSVGGTPDCNDTDANINPSAVENSGDDIDNNCVNDAPVIQIAPGTSFVYTDIANSISIDDPDGDAFTWLYLDPPEASDIVLDQSDPAGTGTIIYSLLTAIGGTDTIAVRACDTHGLCAEASVTYTAGFTAETEAGALCSDGIDNDLDSLVDDADPDCFGVPPWVTERLCSDGEDNDLDGAIDADDSDCS